MAGARPRPPVGYQLAHGGYKTPLHVTTIGQPIGHNGWLMLGHNFHARSEPLSVYAFCNSG